MEQSNQEELFVKKVFIISEEKEFNNETTTLIFGKMKILTLNRASMLFHSQLDKMSKPRTWLYCFIFLCIISLSLVYFSLPCLSKKTIRNTPRLRVSPDKQRLLRTAEKTLNKFEYMICLENVSSAEKKSTLLPDILSKTSVLTTAMPIFFHETSCSMDHKAELSFFQACAVESAANANPNSDIYVLFSSPRFAINENSSIWMQILDSIGNIQFLNNDIWQYVYETPAQKWMAELVIFDSVNVEQQLSNFLRFVSLWKFGGTTIDLDVISFMSLEEMTNFAGVFRNQQNLIGNKVFNFNRSASGRRFASGCLKDFISNFDKSTPIQNGPWVITRVLMEICGTLKIRNITPMKCNFTVVPEEIFHPFDEDFNALKLAPYDFSMIERSYAAYFSEKNVRIIFEEGENVFKTMTRTYCPRVYSSVFN